MHLNSLSFPSGDHCELSLQEPECWLRATWEGLITTEDALRGGHNYLQQASAIQCLYLLNDNTALHGPWFDSLDWLKSIWWPQAQRMGLRYVAHVVQADTHTDILTKHYLTSLLAEVELQIFDGIAEAEE